VSLDAQTLKEVEQEAVQLAWSAGRILLDHFQGPLNVEYKGKAQGDDPVTEADRRAEAYLKEELSRRFPNHAFVGEEGSGEGSESEPFTWVVDPLDGTTNFLNRLSGFACSIALLQEGVPIVAAVFMPWPNQELGRVFHSHRGGGAWDGETPLRVASGESPVPGRVVVVPGLVAGPLRARAALRKNLGERRSLGSTATELALAAHGTYQYVVFSAPRIWDIAAGVLLVQESQGQVLTRGPGRTEWHPLTSFATNTSEEFPGQETLRRWRQPVLAGNPFMVEYVSRHLHFRRRLLRRLFQRFRS
jgi:fructose-1,6-bisphosphatase/inositol monophosphatase family enzyme